MCSVCSRCGSRDGRARSGLCARCYDATWPRRQLIPVDFDEAVVLRAMCGERLPLTRADRLETVRRLVMHGHTEAWIAAVLGLHPRQVARDKQGLGLTARRLPRQVGRPRYGVALADPASAGAL